MLVIAQVVGFHEVRVANVLSTLLNWHAKGDPEQELIVCQRSARNFTRSNISGRIHHFALYPQN